VAWRRLLLALAPEGRSWRWRDGAVLLRRDTGTMRLTYRSVNANSL
jgi:hypothetical protein